LPSVDLFNGGENVLTAEVMLRKAVRLTWATQSEDVLFMFVMFLGFFEIVFIGGVIEY